MTQVQWLCALSFFFMVAGSFYSLRTGSVAAGPFSYSRRDNPVRFYVTVGALFTVTAVCIVFVAVAFGTDG